MAAVLKTAMGRKSHRGFESHTLRSPAQTPGTVLMAGCLGRRMRPGREHLGNIRPDKRGSLAVLRLPQELAGSRVHPPRLSAVVGAAVADDDGLHHAVPVDQVVYLNVAGGAEQPPVPGWLHWQVSECGMLGDQVA